MQPNSENTWSLDDSVQKIPFSFACIHIRAVAYNTRSTNGVHTWQTLAGSSHQLNVILNFRNSPFFSAHMWIFNVNINRRVAINGTVVEHICLIYQLKKKRCDLIFVCASFEQCQNCIITFILFVSKFHC